MTRGFLIISFTCSRREVLLLDFNQETPTMYVIGAEYKQFWNLVDTGGIATAE